MSSDFTAMFFPSVGDTERDQVLQEARIQGHAAGFAAGTAAARLAADEKARLNAEQAEARLRSDRAQLDYRVSVLAEAAAAMNARAVPVLESLERAIAEAALEIAETVLGCELERGETSVRAALARALNPATPAPVHTVRLHPQDLAVLPEDAAAPGVTFRADSSLRRGDAVAEYAEGFLDARLHTAVYRIRTALLEGTE